jgi:hypothetical protein
LLPVFHRALRSGDYSAARDLQPLASIVDGGRPLNGRASNA